MLALSDFDFDLPPELIAQTALPQRSASRLLEVDNTSNSLHFFDRAFTELPNCIAPGDLLVFNNTKVLKARLLGHKASGGKVEILVERVVSPSSALAQIRASHAPAPGSTIRIADAFDVVVGERAERFYTLHFPDSCFTLLERYGRLPLPPYITHAADAYDETRYQTLYATEPGAIAAPTAGLHFDEALLAHLDARGIQRTSLTLHVGYGTFEPVREENLSLHKMHSERYEIPASLPAMLARTRAAGGRIIAVGTTTLRALEAAAATIDFDSDAHADERLSTLPTGLAETQIFITPGYRFRVVDRLITNFHLPKSTLLMLVSAFAGTQTIRASYQHAIAKRYRFFSYGDAMLLSCTPPTL